MPYVDYRIVASESEVAPLLAAFTDAGLSFYVDGNAIAATFNDGPDPKSTIDAIARQFNVPVMRYTPSVSE